jgi:hypothetical protein
MAQTASQPAVYAKGLIVWGLFEYIYFYVFFRTVIFIWTEAF